MKKSIFFIIVAIFCIFKDANAQLVLDSKTQRNELIKAWRIGIGWHFIDDDNDVKRFSSINDVWYPTRFELEKGINRFLKAEVILSMTRYKAGNVLDNEVLLEPFWYYGFDFNLKYNLNTLYGFSKIFDAYMLVGSGLNSRAPTFNTGGGVNLWFFEHAGINIQSVAKFSLLETRKNHLHHSIGFIFRMFNPLKKAFGKMNY